jgi:hypothetical protein
MIIHDFERYFTKAWSRHWHLATLSFFEMLDANGIDSEGLRRKYRLRIEGVDSLDDDEEEEEGDTVDRGDDESDVEIDQHGNF